MMKHIPVVLLVVVLLGVLIYVSGLGVIGKLGSLGGGLFKLSSSSISGITTPPQTVIGPRAYTPPPQTISPTPPPPQPETTINPYDIPAGFTANQLSPYFHKVRLSSVYAGYPGYSGQVSLYAYQQYNATGSVNVTNWTIQGNRGSYIVGQAIDIYDPSGLTAPSDIRLRPGDYINIYTATNSLGPNLHLNKCLGYLAGAFNYTPPLPQNCPQVNSGISGFSGQCQNYILSLGSCALPDPNPPIPQYDTACINFLNNINYRTCFDTHRSDSDFLSTEWRMWTGGAFLDYYHDQVKLFDRNGLVVDYYQY